jgi:hypothetical protein
LSVALAAAPDIQLWRCGRIATKPLFLRRNCAFKFTSAPGLFFTPLTGAGVGFHNHQFSNPASRRASMPAAFLLSIPESQLEAGKK